MSSNFSAFLCIFGIYLICRFNVDAIERFTRSDLKAAVEKIANEAAKLRAHPDGKGEVAVQLQESIVLLRARHRRRLFKHGDIKEEVQKAEDVVESVLKGLFAKDREAFVPLWKHMVDNWVATFSLAHKRRLDKMIWYFENYLDESSHSENKKIVESLLITLIELRKNMFEGESGAKNLLLTLQKYEKDIELASPLIFQDAVRCFETELRFLKELQARLKKTNSEYLPAIDSKLVQLTKLLDKARRKLPIPTNVRHRENVEGLRKLKENIETAKSKGPIPTGERSVFIIQSGRFEDYLTEISTSHFIGHEEEDLLSEVYSLLYNGHYRFGLLAEKSLVSLVYPGQSEDESSDTEAEGNQNKPPSQNTKAGGFFRKLFSRRRATPTNEQKARGKDADKSDGESSEPPSRMKKIGGFFKKLFSKRRAKPTNEQKATGKDSDETDGESSSAEGNSSSESQPPSENKKSGGFFRKLFSRRREPPKKEPKGILRSSGSKGTERKVQFANEDEN